jgi:hypothetical protein
MVIVRVERPLDLGEQPRAPWLLESALLGVANQDLIRQWTPFPNSGNDQVRFMTFTTRARGRAIEREVTEKLRRHRKSMLQDGFFRNEIYEWTCFYCHDVFPGRGIKHLLFNHLLFYHNIHLT